MKWKKDFDMDKKKRKLLTALKVQSMKRTFPNSLILTKVFVFSCLVFALFLYACDIAGAEKKTLKTTKEGKTMETAKRETQFAAAIPPIDAAAPKETETATFALG